MKIVFVSGNLSDGGAQRVISVAASELARMGHEVSLVLFARNEKEYPVDPGVKITALAENFAEYSRMSGLKRILALRKKLKQLKPDAAIGFLEGGYGLFLASPGLGFARVASARIDPKFLLEKKGLRAEVDRLWFRSADAVVVQTTRQMEHAKHAGWHNMTVIANPVDAGANPVRPERPCRRVMMAGRLAKQKNYPMALKAMQQVVQVYPDAVLDIFGKGDQEQALTAMIADMGLQDRVFLRGWTQNTRSELENSDLFILTSDFEGMPNALMEAMAAGLPCVSTDCDTGPEDLIADGENGFLVPVGDADALAQRMIRIMGMEAGQRQAMANAARNTMAENFNSRAIAGKWEALLKQLTEEKR